MAEEVTTPGPNLDYTSGVPRHHHKLYIDDGNIVIQVEKAIFKVHRYFLAKYSTVLQGMFSAPQQDGMLDGTDESPLVLAQDSAVGWELLLDAIYDSNPLEDSRNPSGEYMLAILPIAHKYCMDKFEAAILDRLTQACKTETYVGLMVASQIVGSQPLYQKALGLISSTPKPNLSQAKHIGVEAHYAIIEAALSTADDNTSYANSVISSLTDSLTATRSALSAAKSESERCTFELANVKAAFARGSILRCPRCGEGTACMSTSCIKLRSSRESKSSQKPVRKSQGANN